MTPAAPAIAPAMKKVCRNTGFGRDAEQDRGTLAHGDRPHLGAEPGREKIEHERRHEHRDAAKDHDRLQRDDQAGDAKDADRKGIEREALDLRVGRLLRQIDENEIGADARDQGAQVIALAPPQLAEGDEFEATPRSPEASMASASAAHSGRPSTVTA